MQFSHQYSPTSSNFFQRLPTIFVFFFILFISLISSHSLQLSNFHFFFLYKTPYFSLISSHNLILLTQIFHPKLSSSLSSLIFSMAPKSKKTSYVLSSDAFNLTCWNGTVRLNESPLLTYRPQDHLLEGTRTGLVSFSNFSHFLNFL